MPRSTSWLAIGAFLTGVAALTLATTSWFLMQLATAHGFENILADDVNPTGLRLAAQILLGVSFAAGITSGAFAIGARSAISESQGSMGGRGFYHAGVLVSLASAAGAIAIF